MPELVLNKENRQYDITRSQVLLIASVQVKRGSHSTKLCCNFKILILSLIRVTLPKGTCLFWSFHLLPTIITLGKGLSIQMKQTLLFSSEVKLCYECSNFYLWYWDCGCKVDDRTYHGVTFNYNNKYYEAEIKLLKQARLSFLFYLVKHATSVWH